MIRLGAICQKWQQMPLRCQGSYGRPRKAPVSDAFSYGRREAHRGLEEAGELR